MSEPIDLLYVEDDPIDQESFARFVRKQRLPYECTMAGSREDAVQRLQQSTFDVVVSDYQLGDGNAFEVLQQAGETPVIVVTGMGDEELAVQAIKQGAYDYLTKDPEYRYLKVLPLTVNNALAHRAARQALRESEERFRMMADTAPVMIWMSGPDGQMAYVSKPWLDFTGRTADQELGNGWLDSVHPEDVERRRTVQAVASEQRKPFSMEYRMRRFDGAYRWVLNAGTPRQLPRHGFQGYIGSCMDITERKDWELRQKQLLNTVEQSHEDLLSILNQMRIGVLMTDPQGRITFANKTFLGLVNHSADQVRDRRWDHICAPAEAQRARLQDMAARLPQDRTKISTHLEAGGQQYCVDVEIQDDPRDHSRKIFLVYDMTAVHDLRQLLHDKASVHGIVGKSAPMQTVYEQIEQLSRLDTTVLIEGETGTGKELVARAIHDSGHRGDKPFVALNCAGLSESLLASQLFGHRRGAFTGAVEDQPGHFEAAHQGTLFLDEIGDISAGVQTSLLRVLQEREILRVGESHPRKVDVRIIAATHRDLNVEVREHRFRSDLLYRIRVARIALPTLRERRVDIPLLVDRFLRQFRAGSGKEVHEIGQQAMRLLMDHDWPGNVRELQSAVEFAAIRCKGSVVTADDLPPEVQAGAALRSTGLDRAESERERILAALQKSGGNRTVAARMLEISRATFYRRLAELDIKSA